MQLLKLLPALGNRAEAATTDRPNCLLLCSYMQVHPLTHHDVPQCPMTNHDST